MKETLQYRKVIQLQYELGKGEMRVNMDGTNDNYYLNLDTVELDPTKIDMSLLEISDNFVTMQFSEPIICNVDSGRFNSTMICGTKLEGKDTTKLVERLETLSEKLGIMQEKTMDENKNEEG